jgi:hypothetical protein
MSADQHLGKTANVKWVPINLMKINPLAQRELKQHRVDRLAANFDIERIGIPTVNHRDGFFWLVDGQTRVTALKQAIEEWDSKQIQCTTYDGLSEQEEADLFLSLNDITPVSVLDKFKVGVVAGRPDEVAINKVITKLGLRVGLDKAEGTIKAPGTLRRVYERSGPKVLERTLRLVSETWGDSALQSAVIDGVAFAVDRYGENLDDEWFVQRLGNIRGGVSALISSAHILRKQTSASMGHAMAAAVVNSYNGGSNRQGVRKLSNWWKED